MLAAPPNLLSQPSYPFRFTGTAGEFFAIWIVNLFLSIVTLGIYSAWAKVRKKRYFYAHTWVADANFEYHGNPIAILKGRIIAVVAFAAYSGLSQFMPNLAAALALVLFAAAPWVIARSMAFNAVNSSYRNLRFGFDGNYKDVLRALWPIALVLMLSFLTPEWNPEIHPMPPRAVIAIIALQAVTAAAVYPFVIGSLKRLQVNHSKYGLAPFGTALGIGAFYKIYGVMLVMVLSAGLVVAVLGIPLAMLSTMLVPVIIILAYFGVGSMLIAYGKSRIGNLVFNNTELDGQLTFTSTLKLGKLTRLYLVNLFAILFSFGLAIPWAVVRVIRYRAENLSLQSAVPLDQFVGGVSARVGAAGEELGEWFDIDLSL
jgi:uncharacterized membrane protein YjgN (DUF898 family)